MEHSHAHAHAHGEDCEHCDEPAAAPAAAPDQVAVAVAQDGHSHSGGGGGGGHAACCAVNVPPPVAPARAVHPCFPGIDYRGVSFERAATKGDFATMVLLWTMIGSKGVLPGSPDGDGNTVVHFASLAAEPECLNFLLNNMGMGHLVLEAVNSDGETPLLQNASSGEIATACALIDAGADVEAVDAFGNNIVHNAARMGHTWWLSYVIESIRSMEPETAVALLTAADKEGHAPLVWAAYNDHLATLRYLGGCGVPHGARDDEGRTALHWAAKQGHSAAARFLVETMGASASVEDKKGATPAALAAEHGVLTADLKSALAAVPASKRAPGGDGGACSKLCGDSTHSAYARARPVRPQRERPTNFGRLGAHAALSLSVFLSSFVLPWWGWLLAVFAVVTYSRRACAQLAAVVKKTGHTSVAFLARATRKAPAAVAFHRAKESEAGFWLGCVGAVAVHCAVVVALTADGKGIELLGGAYGSLAAAGGTPRRLLYACLASLAAMLAAWVYCVAVQLDPGVVRPTPADVQLVLASSVAAGGPPNARDFCPVTLVKKPLRAKYTRDAGYVVARMDHWCAWMDTTIGFRNHRAFVVFVFFQVGGLWAYILALYRLFHAEVWGEERTWHAVLGDMFGPRYLGATVMGAFCTFVTAWLTYLLLDQLANIARNVTTNERMNWKRYPWLLGPDGKSFSNMFDRGAVANCCEFWMASRNYYGVFAERRAEPPPSAAAAAALSMISAELEMVGRAPPGAMEAGKSA